MMENYICTTCGTQFAATDQEPDQCPICEDERQYVPAGGQQWTTLEALKKGHRNSFRKKEAGLFGIGTAPKVGIGQRALLLQTDDQNILWDCLTLVDEATVDIINGLGGLDAIAISHPHYYSSMIEWSRVFGDIPIYLHANDREWVMRPDDRIRYWEDNRKQLTDDITLLRLGGHFAGGTLLHYTDGAKGKGILLSGDILQVVADRKHLSFMYSYPNQIPLGSDEINYIVSQLNEYTYDRIYGAFWGRNILEGAEEALQQSAERYLRAIK